MRTRRLTALVVIIAALLAVPPAASAQRKRPDAPFPFSDPEKFFEQFFGTQTEAERRAIDRIAVSARDEQQYGNGVLRNFLDELRRRGIRVSSEGRDVEYVQQLVAVVARQMNNKRRYDGIRVYVAESDDTDAFAFPGGSLIVFRGMLDVARSEAALVGVIGHELSHIDRQHQLYDLRRIKYAQQTFGGESRLSFEQFMQSGMLMMKSFMRPFRPEDELQADRDGATWAYRAGYDPRETAELFARLARRERGPQAPGFLRSHPYHRDRYRAVMQLYAQLQKAEPRDELYVGIENLRQRIPRARREFAE